MTRNKSSAKQQKPSNEISSEQINLAELKTQVDRLHNTLSTMETGLKQAIGECSARIDSLNEVVGASVPKAMDQTTKESFSAKPARVWMITTLGSAGMFLAGCVVALLIYFHGIIREDVAAARTDLKESSAEVGKKVDDLTAKVNGIDKSVSETNLSIRALTATVDALPRKLNPTR